MNAYQAQRIRFGILAARHTLAREAMTPEQVDDLEGSAYAGWLIRDSQKAFDRESINIRYREVQERSRAALRAHGKKAAELRGRWMV